MDEFAVLHIRLEVPETHASGRELGDSGHHQHNQERRENHSHNLCVYVCCSLRSFSYKESHSLKPAQIKCEFVRKQTASWAVLLTGRPQDGKGFWATRGTRGHSLLLHPALCRPVLSAQP